ncbi:MAG: DNA repair exonuclease [Planctomycetaceae bacterium]
MKFLHVADVHLDAPLKGLNLTGEAPATQIRLAMNAAFSGMISLAIEQQVDFVVIAGDLYDGEWTSMRTGLWVADQFRRLEQRKIPVYLLRGNHDNASNVRAAIKLPGNVHEFPVDRAGSFRIDELGVSLHGRGFGKRHELEDMTPDYPEAVAGDFNIGVLHTSLGGDANHSPYAPTSHETLALKGYDYWALGHIHTYRVVRESPAVVYSGCTQGRHAKETGEKGCVLVDVDDHRQVTLAFQPLDVVRWHLVSVRLEIEDGLNELLETVEQELTRVREESDGRLAAVRLDLSGSCRCYEAIETAEGRDRVQGELQNVAQSIGEVWLESIQFGLLPPVSLEELRAGDDLVGEMLRDLQQALSRSGQDHESEQDELMADLKEFHRKHLRELREAYDNFGDEESLHRWLVTAEGCVASLLGELKLS